MIHMVMNGALGRMGQRIIALAGEDPEFDIIGAVDSKVGSAAAANECEPLARKGVQVSSDLREAISGANVVIDFSRTESILETARICGEAGIPLVMGTTGLKPADREKFARLVASIPCVSAPNMSVGVNLLFKLVAETAALLGDEYDVEITEVHHRFKKDAPSGTANRLAEIIAETLDRNLAEEARYGRKGISGERTRNEIGIHALRIGDVVGEHTVSFGNIGERIEMTHRAQSRDALASGALKAAKFVVHAGPGLYDMQDVLGLK
jgi:4-hydroxy-tetrahydrodipicolinate reductase